jgi:SAM-dependent methyltransferase
MRHAQLPRLPKGFEYRLELRDCVTPQLLKGQPVHRWFWFPHSFSPQLVDEILRVYPLPPRGSVLDPFVGAGTTVRRACDLGYRAVGVDLSPLSVFVSQAKLACLDKGRLEAQLRRILDYEPAVRLPALPARLTRAFTDKELRHLLGLRHRISALPEDAASFFRLALLRVQQRVSRAAPDGGWFRWVEKGDQSRLIARWFEEQARLQIEDIEPNRKACASVFLDDARRLRYVRGHFDLVITSPPYPNRHDYSRIFHIELLSLGLNDEEIRHIRHHALRSNIEAKSPQLPTDGYRPPAKLLKALAALPSKTDPRVSAMLQGYFQDLWLTLKALNRQLKHNAICVFVVGNVRHGGVMIDVDEILIELAAQLGFIHEQTWVARLRNNSAQQMKCFGREPARESIVFLRKSA